MNTRIAGASSTLEFLFVCGRLKTEKRTGWVNHHVKLPESISDHMYRMSIISFLVKDPTIDKEKCIKLSLLHDMAEALVGDITPWQGITKEEKHKMEKEAMKEITRSLPDAVGSELYQLWNEYESQATAEAKLVKDFDRLDMIVQAFEYEKAQGLHLQSFFDSTEGTFRHPEIIAVVEELKKRRSLLQQTHSRNAVEQTCTPTTSESSK